ncbi:recombinase family protein [Agrobacterium tumefaciens]|jgi:DNA invertase Pin-like site-specific DNA recombinase|uniref:recombinase family protein n=1 Tax=Agrobacterium tumefaciens TaxID=358 RepID=UPI001571A65E|nr:recombinase family protein [Agrobacterium tumefaciens]NTE37649.1 recombinase family protein [Agrobacterium tumefaciens]NTE53161.1 recombinase family protein [Agrobacterium tumefaciens]
MLIGYARVSTQEQSTQSQEDALRAAGCERIFIEAASGARADRPELGKALEFMREGDQLVVWKLDRLARSLLQLVEIVMKLKERNIEFRSLTDQIDTASAGGRLQFHIFSAFAEFERDLVRERTKAGLIAAQKKGRIGGRPKALSEEDVIQARALMRDGRFTSKEVAKRFNISLSTLYKYVPAERSQEAPMSEAAT